MVKLEPRRALRKVLVYHGNVQGVSFRQTASAMARGHRVTGYVRNLPNGTVELVVEGHESALDKYLSNLAHKMSGYVSHTDVHEEPATHEFESFEIRR